MSPIFSWSGIVKSFSMNLLIFSESILKLHLTFFLVLIPGLSNLSFFMIDIGCKDFSWSFYSSKQIIQLNFVIKQPTHVSDTPEILFGLKILTAFIVFIQDSKQIIISVINNKTEKQKTCITVFIFYRLHYLTSNLNQFVQKASHFKS